MIKVVILGSGNVAFSLAHAIAKSELDLVQIYARNTQKGEEIAQACGCDFTSNIDEIAQADLYIISVSDKAIENLAKKINIKDCVIAHTAGSVPLDVLASVTPNHAVIYPLQTFTYGSVVDFSQISVMIEGSNARSLACTRLVADRLSEKVVEANSDTRKMVHLAAVFSCNFVNHMYVVGERLMANSNMPFDFLKPLIEETTRKALAAKSPVHTQTGPAIRNDFQTKAVHCDMLSQQAELKTMYINLSNSIWETSKKI